jgi:hypothetical protein
VGADVVRIWQKAALTRRNWPGVNNPTGVQEPGMCTMGFHRNVGDPVASPLHDPDGQPEPRPRSPTRCRGRMERTQAQAR